MEMNAGFALVSLVRAALNEGDLGSALVDEGEGRFAGANWKQIFNLSVSQGVSGIAWCGVEAAGLREAVPVDISAAWQRSADETFRRLVLFEVEREQVLQEFQRAGLATLLLKGSRIAVYYPDPRMRSMADNDFLYGFVEQVPGCTDYRIAGDTPERQAETVERGIQESLRIMTARGYETASFRVGNHESFHKKPIFNFEAHRQLFEQESPAFAAFGDPWSRAVPEANAPLNAQGAPLSFTFVAEDEYAFIVGHAFKHYSKTGCGIRFLIDMEVMRRALAASIDWNLVDARMEQLGLGEWEKAMRSMSLEAFSPEGRCAFSQEQQDEWAFLLSMGTYGTLEMRMRKLMNREEVGSVNLADKCVYVWRRLFTTNVRHWEKHQYVIDHPWVWAVLPIYRLAGGLRRGAAQRELKTLLGMK